MNCNFWITLVKMELVVTGLVLLCYLPFWIMALRDSIWSLGKRRTWW